MAADAVLWRTCDQCSEGPKPCTVQSECYICDDCVAFHERALVAAHEAAWGELPSWAQDGFGTYEEPEPRWQRIIAKAVKGYCEFTDEASDNGGPT